MTYYPVWRSLSSDIFTGQIIASLIVLAFLGIFLLREWILQNARPGVFEDDEVLENDPAPPVQPEQQQLQQPEQEHEPPMIEEDPLPPTPGALQPDTVGRVQSSSNALLVLDSKEGDLTNTSSNNQEISEDEEEDITFNNKRRKERLHPRTEDPRLRDLARRREMNEKRAKKGKERSSSEPSPDKSSGEPVVSDFQFTFSVTRPVSPSDSSSVARSDTSSDDKDKMKAQSIPSSPSSSWSTIEAPGPSSVPRRPTLPSSSHPILDELPAVSITEGEFVVASPRSSSLSSGETHPLPSPQLTTFKAPEDIKSDEDQSTNDEQEATEQAASFSQDEFEALFREASGESDDDEEAMEDDHHHMVHVEPPANVDRGRPQVPRPLVPVGIVPPPPQPDENGPAQEAAEDPDAINDDDVDGALEGL